MATTAARITDDAGYSPFYYLKITGIGDTANSRPIVFFCMPGTTALPNDSSWGADAWSGFTAYRGLKVPDDGIEQSLQDVVGGIATPGKVRLGLVDFDAWDSGGTYKYFGRMFAEGRALSDSSLKTAYLDADIAATLTTGGTFTARGADTFAAGGATSYVYIGGETILYSAVARASSVNTFTVGTTGRNQFPCYVNPTDSTNTYPPTPYYRAYFSAAGLVIDSNTPPVTSQPMTMVGRTACLYVGHMRPNGVPEAENKSLALLIGRIQSIGYDGGLFTLELESVTSDLEGALVASDLGIAAISDQIIIADGWRKFTVIYNIYHSYDGTTLKVPQSIAATAGNYTADGLVAEINTKLAAVSITVGGTTYTGGLKCERVKLANGESRIGFAARTFEWYSSGAAALGGKDITCTFSVAHGPLAATADDPDTTYSSLLLALGFENSPNEFTTASSSPDIVGAVKGLSYILPNQAPLNVFIPTVSKTNTTFTIQGTDKPGSRFFLDQGDGTSKAWIRFGDGQVCELVSVTTTTLTIKTKSPWWMLGPPWASRWPPKAYTVTEDQKPGMVEQVFISNEGPGAGDAMEFLTRLLCSLWGNTSSSGYSVLPEGVGLGMDAIVQTSSPNDFYSVPFSTADHGYFIDRKTKFADLWNPIAKEAHMFLVWSPADGKIRLRRVSIPSSASVGASTALQFSESNRPEPNERTSYSSDFSMMRTGWMVKYGYDPGSDTFKDGFGYTDNAARAIYSVGLKDETIKDRGLRSLKSAIDVVTSISRTADLYRYPWRKCTRTVNKTGLLLSPGTVHKVIDATMHNPYTGAFGITSGDNVYALLIRVSANPATGNVTCTFLIHQRDSDRNRAWSPAALVDFDSANNGWTAASKLLVLKRYFTNHATAYDGIDFAAGDKVRLTTMDNDGAPYQQNDDTIASVAADGLTVVLTTGFAALNSSFETVMEVQPYTSCVAAQQSAFAYMGDSAAMTVQATARIHRWK